MNFVERIKDSREVLVLLAFAVTFPLVAFGSTLATRNFRNEITEWSDPNSDPSILFHQYRDLFGSNEYVLITWPGSKLSDPRLEQVESDLSGPEQQLLIERVSSGRSVFLALRDDARLSDETSLKRLRGSIIGHDDEKTAILLTLSNVGRTQRAKVFSIVENVLRRNQVDLKQVRYAGLGHDLYVMDDEGFRSPFRMVPIIMMLALALTWFFVQDFLLAFFINVLGTYTGCLSFTFVYFSGINLNAIVWPLPTLMMLLTVSASLHFLSYYRSSVASSNFHMPGEPYRDLQRGIVRTAVARAWKPILFCALTTTAGLFSLWLSDTRPVRQFGWFGGISVMASSGLMMLCLPAWLTIRPHKKSRKANQKPNVGRLGAVGWPALASSGQIYMPVPVADYFSCRHNDAGCRLGNSNDQNRW